MRFSGFFLGVFYFLSFDRFEKKKVKTFFLREEEEEEEELLVMTAEKVKMREEGRKEGKRERAKDRGQKKSGLLTNLSFFFSLNFVVEFFFPSGKFKGGTSR